MLLHLLLLLSFTSIWLQPSIKLLNKSPDLYIPSYVYKPVPAPSMTEVQQAASRAALDEESNLKSGELAAHKKSQASTSEASSDVIPLEKNSNVETDPVHLIGDKKNNNQPLIKLLGKAIYKRLVYPKIAIDFHLQGVASIGFLVQPTGEISNVSVVKSSGTEVLDDAAMIAIKQISPVQNVNQYLHEPKYLVANIIFR